MKPSKPIAVLGSGSWAIALALLLTRNNYRVKLWSKLPEEIAEITEKHCIARYLPGVTIPKEIEATADLKVALKDVRDILLVVPSIFFRSTLKLLQPYLQPNSRIFWGTKGIDEKSNHLLHEVAQEICGAIPLAVISGPTFAAEVARGLPTAITVAANEPAFAADIVQYLHNNVFRVYTSSDLIGVQIGGAIKNVLAIAVGISDGMKMGANARAALITRGLAELSRLGRALGGQAETFMGLAGLGDLILTCTDNQSRNRRFGLAIGEGKNILQAEKEITQVVEGVVNAKSAYLLSKHAQVEMPIVEQVYRILYEELPPKDALSALLNRTPKAECGIKL